jgi:hypothetical protein
MIKDEMRPYRAVREMQLMEKTVKMVQDAGFQSKAVPPKLLITAVENAAWRAARNCMSNGRRFWANAANPDLGPRQDLWLNVAGQLPDLSLMLWHSLRTRCESSEIGCPSLRDTGESHSRNTMRPQKPRVPIPNLHQRIPETD